jgi:serine/threonine protein kinase
MTAPETRTFAIPCPGAVDLAAFRLGKLRPPEREGIAVHLESCPSCSTVLDNLKEGEDTLVLELRRSAAAATPSVDDARGLALAQKLAELRPTGSFPAESSPQQGAELGSLLGQYELLEQLGQGGMGRVFKARHRLMDRLVAIKIIKEGLLESPGSVDRFRREIQALARLDHPHIVRALDADQAGGMHFLVMEYVEGKDLSRLVREQGPLSVRQACDSIRQAADGLQHAHEHGMVHRDIKPSNLIVTSTGQVKVLDLGLALLRDERAASPPASEFEALLGEAGRQTFFGQVLGTVDFMAPEQWQDTHRVDIRADLYSLGCTLYYLLAAEAPFSGPTYADPVQKRKGHAEDPVPNMARIRGDVPVELQTILNRLLAKSPADRYATPAELAASLAGFLARPGAKPAADRRRRRAVVALNLVLLLLVGLAFWLSRRMTPVPPEPGPPSLNPSPVVEPVRIERMQIQHFRGDPVELLGSIGELSPGARFNDAVRVQARFSQPCYCYLIAFNPDGNPQPCSPANPFEAPKLLQELEYPSEPSNYFPLNDNPNGGLQVFVLAASPRPLESYDAWTRRVGVPPWRHVREVGTWRFDGEAFELLKVARGAVQVRGRLPLAVSLWGGEPSASLAGLPWGGMYLNRPDGAPWVLQNLCWFFQKRMQLGDPKEEAIEVVAFPVQAKP